MKKIKYVLFAILLFISINVKADSNCEKSERTRLTELAKKVEFDYDYKLVDDKVEFSINAVNLNEDLKVVILNGDKFNDNYREFKDNSTHKATLDGFKAGEKVKITILAFVPNFCSYEELSEKTIKLPYYNYYYDEERCKGNEDFKYCKLLIDNNISESEFERLFELYLKNKEEKEDKPVIKTDDNMGLYITIGTIVLAVVVVILIIVNIVNRRKRNRL